MMRESGNMQKWHGRPLVIPSTCHVRLELRVDSRAWSGFNTMRVPLVSIASVHRTPHRGSNSRFRVFD
eukprot:4853078-Lingulodinium_polyedra.AAC.1